MLQRSKITEELLQKPDCFALLTQIALRARRSDDFNLHNLQIGESFIGDYKRAGLTEQRYRTAKNNLAKWRFATFKATNRGTIAKLTDSRVYDINEDESNGQDNGQTNTQATDKQRTINEQPTTKKNYNNEIIKEDKNIIDPQFEEFWQLYKPIHTAKGTREKAKEAFIEALSKDSVEKIMQGLKSYMSDCHAKGTYTKKAESWLKEMMWQGEYGGVAQPELTDHQKLEEKRKHEEKLKNWIATILVWVNDPNLETIFINKYKNKDNQQIINIVDQYGKKATNDEEIKKLAVWLKNKYESGKEIFKSKLKEIANEQNPYEII